MCSVEHMEIWKWKWNLAVTFMLTHLLSTENLRRAHASCTQALRGYVASPMLWLGMRAFHSLQYSQELALHCAYPKHFFVQGSPSHDFCHVHSSSKS